jgi:hypothetical protein
MKNSLLNKAKGVAMPNFVEWYVPERVVVCHSEKALTAEEMAYGDKAILACLEEGHSPVHIIFNLLHLESIEFSALTLLQNTHYVRHPKRGIVLTYGRKSNPFMNMLITILSQTHKAGYKEFLTAEAALAHLQEVAPELDLSGYGPPVLRPGVALNTPFHQA